MAIVWGGLEVVGGVVEVVENVVDGQQREGAEVAVGIEMKAV